MSRFGETRDPERPTPRHHRRGARPALHAPPVSGGIDGHGRRRCRLHVRHRGETASRPCGECSADQQNRRPRRTHEDAGSLGAYAAHLNGASTRFRRGLRDTGRRVSSSRGTRGERSTRSLPAVVAASHHASTALLTPDRAARMVEQNMFDPSLPGLDGRPRPAHGGFELRRAPPTAPTRPKSNGRWKAVVVNRIQWLAAECERCRPVRAVARRPTLQSDAGRPDGDGRTHPHAATHGAPTSSVSSIVRPDPRSRCRVRPGAPPGSHRSVSRR